MDGWRQVTESLWRRESDLPIGRAVAEIRKRDYVAMYDVRVAVTFAGAQLPQTVARTGSALQSLHEASKSCNQFLRELISARYRTVFAEQFV